MDYPRIKIFTRSFDLRLYRRASGLFYDMTDRRGRPIPCVRLTDQSADGYFYTMLKDTACDIAINIDEDAFVTNPEAVLDLVDKVVEEGYVNAGYSDGEESTTGRDKVVTNPFFNVLNLSLIRTRFDRKLMVRRLEDSEPYYPFFHFLAANFKTLYLPSERHSDGTTTIAYDTQGRVLCLHTWFSRFYATPSWAVKFFEPERGTQKARIDAIIRDAYAIREREVKPFSLADSIGFALDRTLRWIIKVPQRVSRWPYKIKRKILRKLRTNVSSPDKPI